MSAQNQMLFQQPPMTYNDSNYESTKTQRYPFLARPPPPQKARPDLPLPPPPVAPSATTTYFVPASPPPNRYRSRSFAHISAWAALVQPGSPAPRSPHRRPSTSSSRRPSLRLNRRPSIAHNRAADGSFVNVSVDTAAHSPKSLPRTATPSAKDFDLTAFGYTSVFVHLPKTPSTPSPFLRRDTNQTPPTPAPQVPVTAGPYSHIPIPPVPESPPPNKRTVKRFRSFGFLRPRSKSTSTTMPPSPTKKSTSSASSKARVLPVEVAKRKKSKYNVRRPPPLANELALLQFQDGGDLESHVQRVMEKQGRLAAGTAFGADYGVADVYRDGKGGIWWDADEELEYQPLIAAQQTMTEEEMQWVKFSSDTESDKENENEIIALAGLDERRGSVDSDLDPKYLVEEQQPDDAILSRKVGMSVLSLPSRPRRAAKHLRKPEFLVDVAAFGARSPRAFGFVPKSPVSATHKPKGKARRRPPPLKLASPASTHKKPVNPSPVDVDRVRKEFMEDSFAPSPVAALEPEQHMLLQAPHVPATPTSPMRHRLGSKVNLAALRSVDSLALAGKLVKRPSAFNMRGLFGKKME